MCFSFLEVSVFFFLLLMIVRGYQRGLLKLSIGLLALLSSVIALNVVNPYIRNQLQENTKINQFVLTTIYEKIGLQNMQGDTESDMGRSMAIDKLNVPTKVKDVLKKNDDRVFYEKLGVYTFSDYIASYVTQMTVNSISFIGSFVLVWLVLGILFKGNKILSKIPVLGGVNQLLGAFTGFIFALIIFWVGCIFIIALSTTKMGANLSEMLECSPILVFLSRMNPIAVFLGL